MMTENIVYNAAKGQGMSDRLAQIIVAQSKHESGNYTSSVFKSNNNAFGYKYVGQKNATAGTPAPKSEWKSATEPQYYAKYASVADSTVEITNWLKRRVNEGKFKLSEIETPDAYANALKANGYFGDSVSVYSNALKKYIAQAGVFVRDNPKKSIAAIAAIVVVTVYIAYRYYKNH